LEKASGGRSCVHSDGRHQQAPRTSTPSSPNRRCGGDSCLKTAFPSSDSRQQPSLLSRELPGDTREPVLSFLPFGTTNKRRATAGSSSRRKNTVRGDNSYVLTQNSSRQVFLRYESLSQALMELALSSNLTVNGASISPNGKVRSGTVTVTPTLFHNCNTSFNRQRRPPSRVKGP
jgi:hypothetical protein